MTLEVGCQKRFVEATGAKKEETDIFALRLRVTNLPEE